MDSLSLDSSLESRFIDFSIDTFAVLKKEINKREF